MEAVGALAYLYFIHLSKQTGQCFIYFIEYISVFLKNIVEYNLPLTKISFLRKSVSTVYKSCLS